MPEPVIDPTSSVLSYPQWLPWNFTFSGTNTPYTFRVDSGGLPPGMSLQPKTACTGVSSTGIVTATGSAFAEGTPIVFSTLTGGSSLTANTVIYFATNVTGATFQLATSAGGAPIALGSDISAGAVYQPGLLTGAATAPGVSNMQMIATNGTGDSAPVLFTIGIEAAAATPDANVDIVWDMGSNAVIVQTSSILNTTPAARATPVIFVKEADDLILRVRTIKNGTVIDLSVPGNAFKLLVKQFEPDAPVDISDGSVQVGTGVNNSQLVHALFSSQNLIGALSDYEEDAGTLFNALAELEVTFPNPGYTIGGETLRRSSQTFTIQIERDLGEGA